MPVPETVARIVGAAGVNITPNSSGLPGISLLERMAGTLIVVCVIAATAGVLLSGIVWALGHHSSNPHQVSKGKTGVVVGAIVACLAGGVMLIINFFYNVGTLL